MVAATLRLKGFKVYDCDSRAKQMMQSDPTLRKSLTEILGDGIYDADGHLRRKETAERLFASDSTRMAVNAVVHEAVRRDITDCLAECHDSLFLWRRQFLPLPE